MFEYQIIAYRDEKSILQVKEKGLLRFLLPLKLRDKFFCKAEISAARHPELKINLRYDWGTKISYTSYCK